LQVSALMILVSSTDWAKKAANARWLPSQTGNRLGYFICALPNISYLRFGQASLDKDCNWSTYSFVNLLDIIDFFVNDSGARLGTEP